MTFCTACASLVAPSADRCPVCGASRTPQPAELTASPRRETAGRRSLLLRLLYIAPVLLVLGVAAATLQRQSAERQWLETAYAAAHEAAATGDLVAARESFQSIAGFRDAAAQAEAMESLLRPLEADYADGLQAIEDGDYQRAVDLLSPVAAQAPALRDVATRLDDARGLLADELLRDVAAAETVHNWPEAERILRDLIALDPAEPAPRDRLSSLQRTHGPIVLGQKRALWLVSPDGSEPHQLTDELHVIWPVFSPDRSQIAFLAPDPDDPMGNVSLYVISVEGGAARRLVDGVSAHGAPSWSPSGDRIAYTSFAGYDPVYESGEISVRVIDVATTVETDLTGEEYPLAFNPSWSPAGDAIAFVVKESGIGERPQHAPGDVVIVRPGTEGFANVTEGRVRDAWSVTWSPTGAEILVYSLFGQTWYEPPSTSIRVLDLETGMLEQVAGIDERPSMPVWSPDGQHFAYIVDEQTIVIADTAGDAQTANAPEALSGDATWSPDGLALIFTPWDAGASSTMVDLSGDELALSPVSFDFDASPPFVSPPQWAPAVAINPRQNPSLPQGSASVPGS